jgi:hypothetical protein
MSRRRAEPVRASRNVATSERLRRARWFGIGSDDQALVAFVGATSDPRSARVALERRLAALERRAAELGLADELEEWITEGPWTDA